MYICELVRMKSTENMMKHDLQNIQMENGIYDSFMFRKLESIFPFRWIAASYFTNIL